ncbi:hypothetical protein CHRY9390_02903 [Chryseobacterium aquaeductus]|uniref:DUF1569 domain-containing protein n=1 Tax=Chryseobacterium aquaeductus TaxID=2675056 RepID=A0A9N8MQJ4_9FLAO|nr:DUF1569 domain-containing protein [Chryseobacterium aquaeductus]CAA7332182.1 hypothetical protein CHRY9390_02903 [Chryseobacterium potabilaquae]CAD7815022.1 hypothetical protein CHRY9390_02903 [Chryseobacterium aquaeductus]
MVRKSLHNKNDFNEIIERISQLSDNSERKWGRMNAAQMLTHCELVLKVPLKKLHLPKTNFIIRAVGILTKKEIQIFNNGIPPNMPSFQKLIVNFECDFETAKFKLFDTLKEYSKAYENHDLPDDHSLFGKMEEKDWGFLEYKHLNHHLKQFNV